MAGSNTGRNPQIEGYRTAWFPDIPDHFEAARGSTGEFGMREQTWCFQLLARVPNAAESGFDQIAVRQRLCRSRQFAARMGRLFRFRAALGLEGFDHGLGGADEFCARALAARGLVGDPRAFEQ